MRMKTAKLCLALLFTSILTAGLLHAQNDNSVDGDYRALMDLYESTNGNNWYDRTGWTDMTPQTMGNAVGIEVNSAGRVISIDMQKVTTTSIGSNTGQHNGNNLTGTLPETIGNLKKVTYFNVKQNKINGEIPAEIGLMESLEWLSLAGQRGDVEIGKANVYDHRGQANGKEFEETNAFTGDLPPEIGNLQYLEVIEIRRQFITGTLPPDWGKLSNIKVILLNNQRGEYSLGGALPPEWGNMTLLQNLDLKNGPADRDTEPTEYGVGFTGEIPQEWVDGIAHDEDAHFAFSRNNLTGTIPYFGGIRNFRTLGFADNNFTGVFPIEYFNNGNNSAIWLFTIENNNLSGEIPNTFTSPTFPQATSNYNNISVLRIGGNDFNGPIPQWIQEMRGHIQINFRNQSFTGSFPKKLAEQPKIRLFFIDGNEFGGDLPDVNWNSDDLYGITMAGNNFTGPIPESWSSMTQGNRGVWRFYANSNDLSGELPLWLSQMPKLERLYLNNNRFTFKDILPNYEAILNNLVTNVNASGSRTNEARFQILDQKPFGKAIGRTMPTGERLVLDMSEFDYYGNQYQWFKDGSPIEGANAPVLEIEKVSGDDEGAYVLEVENLALPELGVHPSQPITFSIGEDDGKNSGDSGSDSDDGNSSGDDNDSSEPESLLFPMAPLQQGPDSSSSGLSLQPKFVWSGVEGADYYELHASQNDPGGMILEVMVEDTSFIPEEIIGQGRRIHWRVRAVKDGENGEWSPIWSFSTQEAELPGIAELEAPGNAETNVSVTPVLMWTDTDSEYYQVRLWQKGEAAYIIESNTDRTEFAVLEPLQEEAEYIWQVKSVANSVEGAWGPRWQFSTGEYDYVVQAPSLLAPGQGVEYETLTPRFEWENVNADRYVISISRETPSNAKSLSSSGDEDTVIYDDQIPEAVYSVQEPLEPAMTYYWQVKGVMNGEEGEWSETWQFTTPDENVNLSTYLGENPLKTELKQNYPNPFNPVTKIEFTLNEVQDVSLAVYNIAGQQVSKLIDGVVQAGRHTATFDAGRLASGVYIYRFISDKHQFTRKMTLVK